MKLKASNLRKKEIKKDRSKATKFISWYEMCKGNLFLHKVGFILLAAFMIGTATAESDDHEKLQDLKSKIQALDQENIRIRSDNLKLSDRISRMSSIQQDIVLALTWKYDELEKKAQVYYNNLQDMKNLNRVDSVSSPKHSLEQVMEEKLNYELDNMELENDAVRNNLVPLLYANSVSRKRQHDKTIGQIRDIEAELLEERSINTVAGSETSDDIPVARSYSLSHTPKINDDTIANFSIQLKSAMPNLSGNSSDDKEHKSPHFRTHRFHPRRGLIPKFADIWFE